MAARRAILDGLDITLPVLAAPMAGGPGSAALVNAAAAAGGLGFLAAGYKTPAALAAEIAAVRSTGSTYGVNVFAPSPLTVDPTAFRRYAEDIAADAETYGLDLSAAVPVEDDDHWQDKIDLLLHEPVPIVSFTFALPARAVVAALQRAGTVVMQTVTTPEEAVAAFDVGVDALAVQASVAGGHSGSFDPTRPLSTNSLGDLVRAVTAAVDVPIVAAGGIGTPDEVVSTLAAGATAVVVGTALLLTPESGASEVHRAALVDPARETVVTRAFTGRPARGLRNGFIDRHEASAPLGYPALHHLTSPLRKAAAAAGDPERVNLWAGVGHHSASTDPAVDVLHRLAARL